MIEKKSMNEIKKSNIYIKEFVRLKNMSIADMFYEEGDELVGNAAGATFTSSYKGILFLKFDGVIAKAKNCAGELDLPPMPR